MCGNAHKQLHRPRLAHRAVRFQVHRRPAHQASRGYGLQHLCHPRYLYDALQGRHQTRNLFRISRGRPNLLDLIHDKEVQWIVNTSETGAEAMVDECQRSEESENMLAYSHLTSKETVQIQMRSKAVVSGIPITTTIAALTSTVEGLEDRLAFNSGCYKPPKASLSHGNSAKASLPSLTGDKHDFGRFEVCSLQEYHRHVKK